jgi:hypothetical protein
VYPLQEAPAPKEGTEEALATAVLRFRRLLVESPHPVTLRQAAYHYILVQELAAKMIQINGEIRKGLELADNASLEEASDKEDAREVIRSRLALVTNQAEENYVLDPIYQEVLNSFHPVWNSAIIDSTDVGAVLKVAGRLKDEIRGNTYST